MHSMGVLTQKLFSSTLTDSRPSSFTTSSSCAYAVGRILRMRIIVSRAQCPLIHPHPFGAILPLSGDFVIENIAGSFAGHLFYCPFVNKNIHPFPWTCMCMNNGEGDTFRCWSRSARVTLLYEGKCVCFNEGLWSA